MTESSEKGEPVQKEYQCNEEYNKDRKCLLEERALALTLPEGSTFVASVMGYFDESGKFKDQQIVSFAGYASDPQSLHQFNLEWRYWLRRFGLERRGLSMKQALKHRLPLSGRTQAIGARERTAVLMNFADCILKFFELGISVAVDVAAFTSLPRDSQKILGKNPHYMAFTRVLADMAIHFGPKQTIAVVCDDEDEYSIECYKIYRKMKKDDPLFRGRLTAISFADDVDNVPLQAADMLASLARLEAGLVVHGTPYDYQSLYNHLTIPSKKTKYMGGVFVRPSLERLSGRLLKAKREGKNPGLGDL